MTTTTLRNNITRVPVRPVHAGDRLSLSRFLSLSLALTLSLFLSLPGERHRCGVVHLYRRSRDPLLHRQCVSDGRPLESRRSCRDCPPGRGFSVLPDKSSDDDAFRRRREKRVQVTRPAVLELPLVTARVLAHNDFSISTLSPSQTPPRVFPVPARSAMSTK